MNPWPDLHSVLKGIPWAIIGGVATQAYMPERMTKDLDILVRKEVKKIITRYSPEDISDLEALIFIGKKEQEMPPSTE